ncbi:MAG: NAD(P)H-hydrate dehydratase [Phycisphaera sp.]|nr:NAD(P)H-hydrate dehydratase [Phycisphaera sp.]
MAPELPRLPERAPDSHKGTFGTVIVVGGCPTMIGAPALCASAALCAGAGLVKVGSVASILPNILTLEPCATGFVLDDKVGSLREALDALDPEGKAVLAVGPGIGKSDAACAWVDSALRQPRPVVLDADGLNRLASLNKPRSTTGPHPATLILTPHPGEYRRLAQALNIVLDPTDESQRPAAAAALAQSHHATVVLKGHRTVISDGQASHTNTTGNPALATPGSGDVLTGMIAGLLAQGMPPWDACVLGVYLHGLAGDLWVEGFGPSGMRASDLVRLIPRAVANHRNSMA